MAAKSRKAVGNVSQGQAMPNKPFNRFRVQAIHKFPVKGEVYQPIVKTERPEAEKTLMQESVAVDSLPEIAGAAAKHQAAPDRQLVDKKGREHPLVPDQKAREHPQQATVPAARQPSNVPPQPEPQVESQVQPPPTVVKRRNRSWKILLFWWVLLLGSAGTGVTALYLLTMVPPLPNCQQLNSPLSSDADRLYCAKQSVRPGNLDSLVAGLNLIKDWRSDHHLYAESRPLMQTWSKSVLAIARQKMAQHDLKGAVAVARQIPANSPVYKEAQTAIVNWQKDWQRGQTFYSNFQSALKAQNWQRATDQMQAIAKLNSAYWQKRLNELRQQLVIERGARRQLQQAFTWADVTIPSSVATPNSELGDRSPVETYAGDAVERLERAILIARQINRETYTYPAAATAITNWSRVLVGVATERLQQQDLAGAIAAAEKVPLESSLTPEVRDLIWFSRAQQLATKNDLRQPLLEQIWNLQLVMGAVRRINPASPFAESVQAVIPRLELQFQDLLQLQIASSIAELGHIPSFQVAINFAQQVPPQHPRRIHAQTLIAHWRQQIQRIEDRPTLAKAQQLIASGTIKDFKAAIAQARKVPAGRALYPAAQAAIAQWQRQIQTIEDKPFLEQARVFAKRKDLGQAIQAAEKVRPGRALYEEAQAAIHTWTTQIQLAEDRPILEQARVLAARGRLTRAIETAAQIGSDRVLSGEAQQAIAQWSAERSALSRARAERRNRGRSSSNERSSESLADE